MQQFDSWEGMFLYFIYTLYKNDEITSEQKGVLKTCLIKKDPMIRELMEMYL